jgi:bifunctional DNA-binding transcriptional regulator/antitoxin component of YhaV-PrlF toxin-antitoxin module
LDGFEAEIESRRKLGLPPEVLAASGLRPGQRVLVRPKRDSRLLVIPLADVIDKFAGAVPGLAAATNLKELRD